MFKKGDIVTCIGYENTVFAFGGDIGLIKKYVLGKQFKIRGIITDHNGNTHSITLVDDHIHYKYHPDDFSYEENYIPYEDRVI